MKRIFDITAAAAALLLFTPLLIVIAALIKLDSPGPVIFRQKRAGKDDREFEMYKFRTMTVGTPELATDKLANSELYITKIGYYLRKYSLDELPQLVNILLGDMSVVGPRPALYNQYDLRRMRKELGISRIKPGLTGWAQVNGRDEITLDKKVEFDKYYHDNHSLLFDLIIIYRTIFRIHTGDRVNVSAN